MVPHSRRRFLQAGAGALAVAAGCVGTDDTRSPDDSDPIAEDRIDELDLIDGVESRSFRVDAVDRPVVEFEHDDENGRTRLPYVVDRSQFEALRLTAEPVVAADDSVDPDDPFGFLGDLDYDRSTGLVVQNRVEACYRYTVQYVEERDRDGVRVQFCRTFRDPDVECSVDTEHVQITLLDVPIAHESSPRGFGSGRSRNCRLPPNHPDVEIDELMEGHE